MKIYGIKNCNSMKKAFDWFDENGISYDFHDYKKQSPDEDVLTKAINAHGWEAVINKKGMTWRKFSDDVKANANADNAVSLALENPSVIKRPLIVSDTDIVLGFDEDTYKEAFL